ncbi:MAG: DNA-binding transcriptional MerR regulator/methylmalonyl-CoA mutase cobalamin-binding subunit [Planctomycetota bacterium]|jgi:DNA-binding transcriptional MerR regulator/methylmalonyl-CoA mutase cobalamin-binding subunit
MKNEKKYTMKVVTRRTGLTSHAIRVWEKRYNAVEPERTDTNRRLYSEADIERLTDLHRAKQQGHSIGRIAQLAASELKALVDEEAPSFAPTTPSNPPSPFSLDDDGHFVAICLEAIQAMDAAALETALMRAEVAMGRKKLLTTVIEPALRLVGDLWSRGELRVADEHLATSVIRTFLGTLHAAHRPPNGAPLLISTTPAEQWHEVGALLASLSAQSEGWRTLYLGPNLPAEEIAATALNHGASAVALSILFPGEDVIITGELRKLSRSLVDIPLLIGGRASAHYASTIEEIGAYHLRDLKGLPALLQTLHSG